MKVLIIVTSKFPYTYGGIATHVYNLVRNLASLDGISDILLVARKSYGKVFYPEVGRYCNLLTIGRQEVSHKSQRTGFLSIALAVLHFNVAALIIAMKTNADVIHCHYGTHTYGYLWAPIVRLLKGIRIVTTVHSSGIKKEFERTKPRKLRDYFSYAMCRIEEKIILIASHGVIVLYPELELKTDGNIFVPQGIDTDRFKFLEANEERRFLYIGRLYWSKSVIQLLRAYQHLEHDIRPGLDIVGDGPQFEEISRYISENLADASVRMKGSVSNVSHELGKGGIFVLPSQFEGFSISLLEAMARGLPAIVTAVGANRHFFENYVHCIFVGKNGVYDLPRKMQELLESADLRERIRRNARELVEKRFDWKSIAKKTLQVYVGG